ncbi:MAG: hypothetical protein J6W79_03145 [Alphaproteobacteria bacterium]|nr:hypothetical protein [Alphaproteobacteria bacterium]
MIQVLCHCERSEAIQSLCRTRCVRALLSLDRHVITRDDKRELYFIFYPNQ